ncbi:uncharacterized protein LOC111861758 [Cryptotermes secundus]|uniref:uncharacterized protein LOC111861758 n=1 Tax=Cryptotermes secundus TaxID=105785 RepID=UPI000CD7DE97|nr:uncharacterized protein LOC111861758 [Cryptotermes secundus]
MSSSHVRAMWMTLDLLVAREWRKSPRDLLDELEEWLESIKTSAKIDPPARSDDKSRSTEGTTPTLAGTEDLPKEKKKKLRKNVKSTSHRGPSRFSQPDTRLLLEKLMGTSTVRLTDREFMQKLQERICEDRLQRQSKRIQEREAAEVEREKKLILEGKIPVEEASKELMKHPVFEISKLTKKIIEEKRTKVKLSPASASPCYHGNLDEADGGGAGEAASMLGTTAATSASDLSVASPKYSLGDSAAQGFMFTQEEYDRIKYESPLVKKLRKLETVDELYALAEEIVGPLKTVRRRQQHCGGT